MTETKKRARSSPLEVERSLETLSRFMDNLIRVPGTDLRFGLDSIIGLIPGVGDSATALASFYVLAAGVRYRVPKITLLRMGLNIAVDWVVGALPLVGDAFDVYWKSNARNIELIRQRATVRTAEEAKQGRASDWLFVGVIALFLLAILFGSLALSYIILRWILSLLTF